MVYFNHMSTKMDLRRYEQYLAEYIDEAIANSDGSNAGIAMYLSEKSFPRFFVKYRSEKQRALADAIKAFDEHRHWPREIILSHLGIGK